MSQQLGQPYSPPTGTGPSVTIPNSTSPQKQLQLDRKQQIFDQMQSQGDTYKVLASALDSTPGYLGEKLTHGEFSIVSNKLKLIGFGNLTTSNLTEGSKLFYTESRFNTSFANKTTDSLPQGVINLYFSNSLFDNRFATKTTDNLPQGSNNFYLTTAIYNEVTANTAARHSHSNKTYLDAINRSGANINDAVDLRHLHSNLTVLNATTEPFTIALKALYDSYGNSTVVGASAPISIVDGIIYHSNADGNKHVPSNSSAAQYDILNSTAYAGDVRFSSLLSILNNTGVLEQTPSNSASKITSSAYILSHIGNGISNVKHITNTQLIYLTTTIPAHIANATAHIPPFTISDVGKYLYISAENTLGWSSGSSSITTSGESYITALGSVITIGKPTLDQVDFTAGENISFDAINKTISAIQRSIDNEPVNGNNIASISSDWAYNHKNGFGVGMHIPSTSNSGQFLAWDGTFKDVAQYSGNSDILDYAIGMQNDNVLNPGLSPSVGDRYIILNPANLNSNFGTIVGLGVNDIVEYSGGVFIVSFDSSAATASVSVTVTTDVNGNFDREWYYSISGSEWRDRGVSGTSYWGSTAGNLSPISLTDSILLQLGQKISWDTGTTYLTATNTNEFKLYTNSIERIVVNNDNIILSLPAMMDSISERTLNNGVVIDGSLIKDNTVTSSSFNITSASTRIGIDGSNNMIFTDAVSGTKTLAELATGGGSDFATEIHGAESKTLPPTSADELGLVDSASGFTTKKLTWINLKNALKSYFDNIYSTFKNLVEDTTPQLGGFLDTNNNAILESRGANVASAATLVPLLGGNLFNVDGTTTINDILTTGVWKTGSRITLRFAAACTLTHNGTITGNNKALWLAKGSNYTTVANDVIVLTFDETYWREVNGLTKASSAPGGGHAYQLNGESVTPRSKRNVQNNGTIASLVDDAANDATLDKQFFQNGLDVDVTGKKAGSLMGWNPANDKLVPYETAPFVSILTNSIVNISTNGVLSVYLKADYSILGIRIKGDANTTGNLLIGSTSNGFDIGQITLNAYMDTVVNLSKRYFSKVNDTNIYISGLTAGSIGFDFVFMQGVISEMYGFNTQSVASASTIRPYGYDRENEYNVTSQAESLIIAAPVGTPMGGNTLLLRIKDNGTARTLVFNAIYKGFKQALPAATTPNKEMYLGFIYNSATSRWDLVGVENEI